MATSYTIAAVENDDLSTLADLVHTSKLSLPINQLLFKDWPNDAAQKPLYTQAVVSSHHDPAVTDLKAVDDVSGQIIGYIAFTRKQGPDVTTSADDGDGMREASDQQQQNSPPEGLKPDVLAAVAGLNTEESRHFSCLHRYDVTYICTAPFHKRRGVGWSLLQPCLDMARAEGGGGGAGLPVCVCSEPAAREFFESAGFQGQWHYDIDLAKFAPQDSGYGLFRLTGMVLTP